MVKTKGLEGVVATTSSVSSIVDDVLTYRGYSIDDLAEYTDFEEVIYLLWYGKLPSLKQLAAFRNELNENVSLPSELIAQLKSFPIKNIHPMAVLRTCVSALALYDKEADDTDDQANLRKAIRLQAKIPAIIAAYARICEGKEPIIPEVPLSFSANFLYMLKGSIPDQTSEAAFNKALVLHADHELNASTFTSRVCVATLSDMYSGITAAIGALKGPLHGGANERVMKMLSEIDGIDFVEPYLQRAFANKEKIMGFGHRVYKNGDPRAKHLREMSRLLTKVTGEGKWYNMSIKIEEIIRREKGLLPNVDFYSASVYHCLGIKHNLFTPIFAISRTSGWIAHILEQYENNRLIRPRAEYIGLKHQAYVPLAER
ncbi:citrate synthase [Bacillus salipaludis]|uniref:citrate synthase n=1 Tax=Bacillus salipaludis TaxID=2547811 RepID=UPI002E1F7526|nr:citrate synthase [Bacillus salipaludis]